MRNRFTTAQSTVATSRWVAPSIMALAAALAALTAAPPTTYAASNQARPAAPYRGDGPARGR